MTINCDAKSDLLFILQAGGPYWDVPKGRKDGRVSKASETIKLPGPGFNLSQLQKSFSQRGLSMADLVALSGPSSKQISNFPYKKPSKLAQLIKEQLL